MQEGGPGGSGAVGLTGLDFCSAPAWAEVHLKQPVLVLCVLPLGSGDKVLALAGFEVEKAKK